MEAHPEPCSVYMLTSGALLLQNRAARDLGLAGSLQALFAFDQGSLHDALSKFHTSIPPSNPWAQGGTVVCARLCPRVGAPQ
jgi:hypothetical protein